MASVILKKGRDKSVLRKHPWIFSGAIDSIKDIIQNGQTVEIKSFEEKPLGYGSYSSQSQIAVRVLTFNPQEEIDKNFFQQKIKNAIELRNSLFNDGKTNAFRLINSESDSIPGLIVDKYNNCLVCQFLSAGVEYWKKEIVEILVEILNPEIIYERSDSDVRLKEGMEQRNEILMGKNPPDLIEILENGNKFLVDIKNGHKTGFYLDQRDNRKILSEFCDQKNVLNCFSYSGGFSVYAINGGAVKVTNIDSSKDALDLAERNFNLNGVNSSKYENIIGDVFQLLRKYRDSRREFDIIILDPPKFAESIGQVEKASRGYKDINLLATKILKRGGFLFTFSCSGHITFELFGKIISDAALDSGRSVKIFKYLTQSLDHPIITNFPESLYLKGLICKIT